MKSCELCGKHQWMGNTRKLLRGHYNVTGRRTFAPNLQKTKHEGQRLLICTQCLRTLHKAAKAT